MTALFPIVIPALLGYFALTTLLRSVPIRYKNLFLVATSLPTGFGICALLLFVSLWIMPLHSKYIALTVSILAALILAGFLLFERLKSKPPPFLWSLPGNKKDVFKAAAQWISFLVFLMALWAIIQFYMLSVSTNITGGWDARYMWSLKAKFMFRSPADWQAMFSPALSWSHTDYPLLWPGTMAWGWNCLEQESLFWPPWASLCFYISCAMLVVWYLAAQVSPITGWIAGTFFLGLTPPLFWSIHQYADVPFTFFITASGLLLITALRSGQARLVVISGLMAGFAAWTKNEGLLFLLWICLLIAGLKLLRKRDSGTPFSFFSAFFKGALFPLVCVMVFKIFLGKNGDYFGSPRSMQEYLTIAFNGLKNGGMILQAFWDHMSHFPTWKGLWAFFLFACFALPLKKEKHGDEIFILVLILLINLGYILAFLTTPNDLRWHIQTAFERLLIHTAPLALVFSFEILTFRRKIAPQ